jgi:hypothetical protein
MAITKHKIQFDPSNPAEHDTIGTYITDGTEVANVNASNQLEVSVENTVAVTATDLDIRDLDHTQDNVAITSTAGNTLVIGTDGSLNVTDNGGSLTVDASDLDIRDLTHVAAQDSVQIGDGTNLLDFAVVDAAAPAAPVVALAGVVRADTPASQVDTDGDTTVLITDDEGKLWVNAELSGDVADDAADGGVNSVKIGSVAQDTGTALTAVSANGDRADLTSDQHRRIHVNDSMNVAWSVAAVAVSTTAVQLDATKLSGRKKVVIQNLSNNKAIAIGSSSSVLFTTGIVIPKNASMDFEFGEALNVYAIGASGASSEDIRILQAG